jgi:hypothetical protein
MSTQTLVTPTAPWPPKWRTSYVLEGSVYWLQFAWNDRDGFWYLAIGGSDLVTQAQGVTLNIGTDKLRPFKYGNIPPGRFDVVDTSGLYTEPTRNDMGARVLLQYTDAVDVVPVSRELFPMTSAGGPS